jgi:hypothetical protein
MSIMSDPATGVFAITPADGVVLAKPTRAIRATGAGNVSLVGVDGVTALCAFLAGETRVIRAKIINATLTTATGLEGMY